MDELLLGIDIGTSSSKAVLARPDGRLVATAKRPHQTFVDDHHSSSALEAPIYSW